MIINDNLKRLVLQLPDFAVNSSIGTSANTVDRASSFEINQTTAGVSLTLPTPTDSSAGDLVILSNTGTTGFMAYGINVLPSTFCEFMWNGLFWVSTSVAGNVSDKTFSMNFSGDNVNVNHNLGKYPAVSIMDNANIEIEANITHTDANNCVVTLNQSISGIIICN